MRQIRLHMREPGLHGLGIEYNWDGYDWESDATDFIRACRKVLDRKYGWFHQCGSGESTGYQFFEMLGCDSEDVLLEQAQSVAKEMGVGLTI